MFCREFSVKDFGTLSEIKQQRTVVRANNQDNQRKQDGTRSSRKVKFSLKDSDGNELDNSNEIRYSSIKNEGDENGRKKTNQERGERVFGRRDALYYNRGAGDDISVSFNVGRSKSLRAIITEKNQNESAK